MNLIAVKDLKAPKLVRERLQQEGELLLTNDGRPMAVLVNVGPMDDPATVIQSVREARSRIALSRIRETAQRRGTAALTAEQIAAEIAAVRKARRARP